MAEENKVRLHGMWVSPFVRLVKLALEIKGTEYEYVEEDLKNKSLVLLNYNPIHKKVPVLVVNGKPLVESLIILEYIDETWKNGTRFLPEDPYKRAQIRFWCSFIHKQVSEKFIFEFMPLCMVNITWLIDRIYTMGDIKRFLSYKSYKFNCHTYK